MEGQFHDSWCTDLSSNMSARMSRRRSSNSSGKGAPAPIIPKNSHVITTDQIEDVLARIVHRVDLNESHEGDGSTAERWSTGNATTGCSNQNKGGSNTSGPLTTRELSDLSFLCSAIATAQPAITKGQSGNKNNFGFANVDIDSVLSVMELLDRHVNLAVNTNVIESAACILSKSSKSPSQAASALEQVREIIFL
jgi:hypothetical protein